MSERMQLGAVLMGSLALGYLVGSLQKLMRQADELVDGCSDLRERVRRVEEREKAAVE